MPSSAQRRAGRLFRYRLTLLLRSAGRPLSVGELVDGLQACGVAVPDPAHKVVADALRREVLHGRVRRVGRGRYATGSIPPGTVRWMRHTLALEQVRGGPAG